MRIKRLKKEAMPARLGEIEGIVPSMPVNFCDEAKEENPQFDHKRVKRMVDSCKFLTFTYYSLGSGDYALRNIFSTFILEDDYYCKKYKES
jgi:hypothetical protein